MIWYLLTAIAILWTSFATISDIKTREVSDWLNYSLIAIGFGVRFIYSLVYNEWIYLWYGFIGFVAFFMIANLMYYAKQWGGGDAKLLMGYGVVFGNYPTDLLNYFSPNLNTPFLAILIINLILFGGVYALIYSISLAIKNRKKFLLEFRKLSKGVDFKLKRNFSLFLMLVIIIISLLFDDFKIKLLIYWLALFVLIFLYLTLFVKSIENISMFKSINTNKLTEGDWVIKPILFKGKVIYMPERLGITKKNIEMLKRLKIKNILIKEGLPFVPSFLIALIISLIFGNVIIL